MNLSAASIVHNVDCNTYSGILNAAKDEQKHDVLPMRQYLDDLHVLGRWQKESSVVSRSEQIPIE